MSTIVSKMKALALRPVVLILLASGLVGCSFRDPGIPAQLEPPPKAVDPTPTTFLPPTPYQGGPLWVSPALPGQMLEAFDRASLQNLGFPLVADPDQAQVRIIPGGDANLATWVYALVAPFPTTTDGIGREALLSLWLGDEGDPLLIGVGCLPQMEVVLGPPGANVRVVEDPELLDEAWDLGNAFAIIPFEALEPRWKVLTIDGQAPIQKGFKLEQYPLQLSIAVEGPEGAAEWLVAELDIPASNFESNKMTVLVMTGVTALTRATAWQMERRGVDFPAEKIGDWLLDADLTHISNEVAFASNCPYPDPEQEGLKFCSDPAYIGLLETIGSDIIELTGNHVRDYGSEAFASTLEAYSARGWGTFGGGIDLEAAFQPLLVEHNGNRLAFLGCNYAGPKYAWATELEPGSTPCEEQRLFETVAILKEQGYQVIFTYQWVERNAVAQDQRLAFEATVDAGASIVSGSQAHQPLAMAFYKDGFLHYGLGNLFFDQMQTQELRSEMIDRHVFYAGRHISTELLSAMLESYAQPRPMTASERAVFLARMFIASGW